MVVWKQQKEEETTQSPPRIIPLGWRPTVFLRADGSQYRGLLLRVYVAAFAGKVQHNRHVVQLA